MEQSKCRSNVYSPGNEEEEHWVLCQRRPSLRWCLWRSSGKPHNVRKTWHSGMHGKAVQAKHYQVPRSYTGTALGLRGQTCKTCSTVEARRLKSEERRSMWEALRSPMFQCSFGSTPSSFVFISATQQWQLNKKSNHTFLTSKHILCSIESSHSWLLNGFQISIVGQLSVIMPPGGAVRGSPGDLSFIKSPLDQNSLSACRLRNLTLSSSQSQVSHIITKKAKFQGDG